MPKNVKISPCLSKLQLAEVGAFLLRHSVSDIPCGRFKQATRQFLSARVTACLHWPTRRPDNVDQNTPDHMHLPTCRPTVGQYQRPTTSMD